jgi:hypothetical protein
MDGTFMPFRRREEFGPGRTSSIVCRISAARACWRTSNGSFTSTTKHSPSGFPTVGSSSRMYWEVYCCARALWSPCGCGPPGNEGVAVLNTSGGRGSIDAVYFSSDLLFVLPFTISLSLTSFLLYCDLILCMNQVWAVVAEYCSHLSMICDVHVCCV